jgi:phthalate 4,5-dioxygenase
MLSREENDLLCRIGPGTLMGNLLRRYWTPACLSSEVEPDGSPLRVRLLGEDLIAFRDTNGTVGLIDEACPHRGASLFYGRNEECGLRCIYHGWKFDTDGRCTDMPSEPRPFADRIRVPNYPTHESGGIVWTYLGPRDEMTPFRNFGTDELPSDQVSVAKMHTTCNWVQSMEGNIDTAHISHLHQFFGIDEIADDGSDKPGYPSNAMSWKFWRHDRAPRLEISDEWYGYRYAGIRETPNGNTHVRITAFVMPYGTVVASVPFTNRIGMFVPIDDENCWRYTMVTDTYANPQNFGGANLFAVAPFSTPFSRMQANGGKLPPVTPRDFTEENDYQIDREIQRTVSFSGIADFVSQDLAVTESMKPIYNREKEHLGSTDVAIIRMRTMLLDAARGLEKGVEPPGVSVDGDFRAIRGAEKILEDGEDWRVLGTNADPAVIEALASIGRST